MELRGMDSVFRVEINGAEHYILEDFGKCEGTEVLTWVNRLKAGQVRISGVVCPYDMKNLLLSVLMLRNSLTTDMLCKVHGDGVGPGSSGPMVVAAAVRCHQSLSSGAVRTMIMSLHALQLHKEPKEDVDKFVDKVQEIGKRIESTGAAPNDLHEVIYECFSCSSNSKFNFMVTEVQVKAGRRDPTVRDWDAHLIEFKAKYRELKARGLWDAEKLYKEKETSALKAAVEKLKQSSTGQSSGSKSDGRECYHCGKKGHIKPNCPDKDTPKDQLKKGGPSSTSAPNATPSAKKTPPKEGESHTKSIEGASHKWCSTCKRWNTGAKAHHTSEHVKGAGKKPEEAPAPPAPAANALASANNESGPSLRLIGGYMASMALKDEAGQR